MRSTWLVLRHEVITLLRTRSFWVMTFTFPLVVVALTAIPQVLARRAFNSGAQETLAGATADPPIVGYVDQAHMIARLPRAAWAGKLHPYPDENAARAALAAGVLDQYYVIPPDFAATGKMTAVLRDFSPLANLRGGGILERAIAVNLLGDEALAALVADPTGKLELHFLTAPVGEPSATQAELEFALPFTVMFALFFVITVSAGYMLQSVTKEKQSRTAEILLLSLRPRELMLGKLSGLGLVALLQVAVWLGAGLLLTGRGSGVFRIADVGALPPGLAAWLLAYAMLGYVVYAAALGAVGALAPGMREGSQVTFILLLPLLLPLLLNAVFMEAPDGPLATALSLFPLTAPTSMVTRLAAGHVPVWQPIVGLVLLAATAYLFVMLAARFFRAENLISEANLDWRRLGRTLR